MSEMQPPLPQPPLQLTTEDKARQTKRSRAIGWTIAAMVVLFYVITVIKMGSAIFQRPL
jgi:hypothetical protein